MILVVCLMVNKLEVSWSNRLFYNLHKISKWCYSWTPWLESNDHKLPLGWINFSSRSSSTCLLSSSLGLSRSGLILTGIASGFNIIWCSIIFVSPWLDKSLNFSDSRLKYSRKSWSCCLLWPQTGEQSTCPRLLGSWGLQKHLNIVPQ